MMQTREKILRVLKRSSRQYISGQVISDKLALSRTAVWKHVQVLRKQGYKIEGSSRQGYQFIATPDLLLPAEIRMRLETKILGKEIFHYDSLPSTNEELKRIALDEDEGTLVIAEQQESGRGRLNRDWYSPKGGLWFSVLFKPSVISLHTPKFALAAAVAVAQAINKALGLNAGIKWPNDVIIGKKKVAGILTEMAAQIDRIDYIILGIGVNANLNTKRFPRSLRSTSTSLKDEIGDSIDRVGLLIEILEALEDKYVLFRQGKFSQLLKEWRRFDTLQGKIIRVKTREKIVRGVAKGIDDEGNLKVRTSKGIEHIITGDVLFT